jgi:ferrochelatase
VTGARTGALLLNLGTPDSTAVSDVRRYLREFLSDPRVIDIPRVARWLLVQLIIVPFRAPKSARAYAKIWTQQGSPLLVHSRALSEAVAQELDSSWVVELAMRYREPSIRAAVGRLAEAKVDRLVVLPLFPQYAEASTGSALAKLHDEIARGGMSLKPATIGAFYDEPGFTNAVAEVARAPLRDFGSDFVLFSYHGLPERQVCASDRSGEHCLQRDDCCASIVDANRDCYRAHCFATTRSVAHALELAPDRYATSFQSRLGRTPWIQPFTDQLLPRLAARGVRRLAVICPSFTADCLETLEEIGIRAAEQWRALGGDALTLVPAVNAHPVWVRAVADLLRRARDSA